VFEDLAIGLRSAHSAGMLTCAVNSCDDVQDIAEVQGSADLWLADWQDIPLG
jgi:beta-phosphoglucomutase-like phosphatase (HAD superfamily)